MKKTLLLLALCTSQLAYAKPARMTLLEAMRNQQVKVVATGNPTAKNPTRSSHTGKCLRLQISNPTKAPLEYQIENAYHLTSLNDKLQDLITIENLLVVLAPGQSRDIELNALCGEKNNAAPSETDTFTLSYRHTAGIERLTALLENLHEWNNTAQQAMWCFTDQNPLDAMYDTHPDTLVENKLVALVAKEKNLPIPARQTRTTPQRIIRYPLELEGSHAEQIERTTTIGFYITDSANHVLSVLIEDDTETRHGTAKYSYIYRGQYPAGRYFLKMKKNGEWISMKEIKIGEGQ